MKLSYKGIFVRTRAVEQLREQVSDPPEKILNILGFSIVVIEIQNYFPWEIHWKGFLVQDRDLVVAMEI